MTTTYAPNLPALAGATYNIDPAHSFAEFAVKHMMVETVKGRFGSIVGSLVLDEANPGASSVNLSIDVASLDSGVPDRDAHLRSDDFFNAEKYPTITFASKRITPVDDTTFRVAGDLTIRDITREIELDVEYEGRIVDAFGLDRVGFTGETTVNRKEFGLKWNMLIEAGGMVVADKAKLTVHIGAVRA